MLRSLYRQMRSVSRGIYNYYDPPVLVLLYHRVTTLESDPQMLAVSPDNFLNQMGYLKDRFPILEFESDWARVREPSIVVTFDDGYADNYLEALPILMKTGIPATFFVTSDLLGSDQEFWWDELERIIVGKGSYPTHFEMDHEWSMKRWITSTEKERINFYREIHPIIRTLLPESRDIWFHQLRCWANADMTGRATHRIMKIEELRALSECTRMTIGAHGRSHTSLGGRSNRFQENEMTECKKKLETIIEKPVRSFSYPFGTKSDYSEDTMGLCKRTGFKKAAANYPGRAYRETNCLEIPRQIVRDWPLDVFKQKIKEFWTN